jgi:hypothetical protein
MKIKEGHELLATEGWAKPSLNNTQKRNIYCFENIVNIWKRQAFMSEAFLHLQSIKR